ncbi:hypothetical protein NMY22_g7533 [Coprinellus aureogranulatus]|nr:hypothetical protein NMY22_g7533 [Coprinellus aureogranulatus]
MQAVHLQRRQSENEETAALVSHEKEKQFGERRDSEPETGLTHEESAHEALPRIADTPRTVLDSLPSLDDYRGVPPPIEGRLRV